MPAPQVIQRPFTVPLLDYYANGANTGDQFDYSLDPHGTPVVFGFASESINANNTAFAQAIIALTSDIVAGDSITIFGERFVASDNPTENQFYTLNVASPQSINLSAQTLTDTINTNNNLNWRFVASYQFIPAFNLAYITVRAIRVGKIYNFVRGETISGTVASAPNFTTNNISVNSGLDSNRGSLLQGYNYGYEVEIYVPLQQIEWGRWTITDPKPPATLLQRLKVAWNETNLSYIDISRYLRSLTTVPLPDSLISKNALSPQTFIELDGAISAYWLRYAETFNGGYDINNDLPQEFDVANNQPITPTNKKSRAYNFAESNVRWTAEGVFRLGNLEAPFPPYWGAAHGRPSKYLVWL